MLSRKQNLANTMSSASLDLLTPSESASPLADPEQLNAVLSISKKPLSSPHYRVSRPATPSKSQTPTINTPSSSSLTTNANYTLSIGSRCGRSIMSWRSAHNAWKAFHQSEKRRALEVVSWCERVRWELCGGEVGSARNLDGHEQD